jgi:hypothetical protein
MEAPALDCLTPWTSPWENARNSGHVGYATQKAFAKLQEPIADESTFGSGSARSCSFELTFGT